MCLNTPVVHCYTPVENQPFKYRIIRRIYGFYLISDKYIELEQMIPCIVAPYIRCAVGAPVVGYYYTLILSARGTSVGDEIYYDFAEISTKLRRNFRCALVVRKFSPKFRQTQEKGAKFR